MKRRILAICMLLLLILNIFGCGNAENSKKRPSDEELANASKMCGIIREVSENSIRVQLCGNYFIGEEGHCYIDILNEYEAMDEGDRVLMYYTGELKAKKVGEYMEAYNVEICYMEYYENDGQFVANLRCPNSLILDKGEVQYKTTTVLTPLDNEPEWQFIAVLSVSNYIDGRLDPDNPGGLTDVVFEIDDASEDVIVTYDIDTMEVISITQ